jgi:hypothetical protein
MKCSVCGAPEAQSYHVGNVRGRLCAGCMQGAGVALASWALKRMRSVQREQDMLARRANEERAIDVDVSNELLPLSTRRAMRRAG